MLSRYVESYVDFIQNLPHDDDDEVYSAFFHPTASPVATPHAFVEILAKLPDGSRLLDLGMGSGVYLEHAPVNEMIRAKKLTVDGVDISAPNVAICQRRIVKAHAALATRAKTKRSSEPR